MAASQMKRVAPSKPLTSAAYRVNNLQPHHGFARSGPCQQSRTINIFLLLFVQENLVVDEAARSCVLTMLSVPGENIFEPGPGT